MYVCMYVRVFEIVGYIGHPNFGRATGLGERKLKTVVQENL